MPVTFEIAHTYAYSHYPTAYEVLDDLQIFYISWPYLFFHIYYHLSIPYLVAMFVFSKCLLLNVKQQSQIFYIL